MAAIIVSSSDDELEDSLREADEEYAFRIQLQELSNCTFSSLLSNPSSSKHQPSFSILKDDKEYMPLNYYEHHHGFEFQNYGGQNGGSSRGKEVDTGLEWRQCSVQVKKPKLLELCGICFEESAADMFEGIGCLHHFCRPCMTKYIHTQLEQKRHQIYCPHESCRKSLTPEECGYFLPGEIIDAWFAIIVEAEIPDSQKVYCPFPDCSAMLVKEDVAEEILNAECPFCNRMFCVKCMVPWHADVDCEERSEEDRHLFKLAEAQKWQRCGKCKRMIEKLSGCNQMRCRCGYNFCYGCGTGGSCRCR